MKSWKTTVGGILMAAGEFVRPSLPPQYDWIATVLTGIGGLLLGLTARDNNRSSEDVGAK